MTRYYGRDGRLISLQEMTRLFGPDNQKCIVGKTKVGEAEVSTVLLVIDREGREP